jgi:nitroreductase
MDMLRRWVDLGRIAPSARNQQPLKFILCRDPGMNENIFPLIAWAGALEGWPGPAEGSRPSAYIAVLHDTSIPESVEMLWCDTGLACQNILLAAVEEGCGGCLIGAFEKGPASRLLEVAPPLDLLLLIALGKPREQVVLEDLPAGGSVNYYRDESDAHHVPKRTMRDLIVREYP